MHDLTDPELYPLACDWLRGDDLSEESMQALKVKHCIETEDAAKNILANFGKIATETQPLVLCFDQLDNIPRSSDGAQDFQSLFNVNTIVHNENLKNFLVVISIITNTWKQNVNRIQQADRARIHLLVQLKSISLEQSEALWAYQLKPLHAEANPTPDSPIFPLTRQMLEGRYPGGKTLPRYVIQLGRKEYQDYKEKISPFVAKETSTTSQSKVVQGNTISAEFQLLWQQEFKKAQGKVTKISLFSAPELIRMLQEVLAALEAIEIRPKLLSGRYAGYSLSYQRSHQKESIGIVWAEDANMTTFYHVMNACQRAIGRNSCQILYLIRAAAVGHIGLAGNQIYRRNFTGTRHPHIKPDLASVQKLATYHSLVNSVLAHEVILDGKIISLKELEWLTRESEVMHDCHLLQDLDIIARRTTDLASKELDLQPVKNYLFNLVKTQHFMGQRTLKDNTLHHFSELDETQIDQLIAQLCQENKIKIINPKSKPDEQTVLLVT